MRILLFLLDTVFFVWVGAALLRGWMNTRRLRMTQQPGRFVMAITNWLVQPVRKALPRRWSQANTDWGSWVSAVLLALVYSALWHLLALGLDRGAVPLGGLWSWPVLAGLFMLRTLLQGVMLLVLAQAILSWTQPHSQAHTTLHHLVEPWLRPLRRLVPVVGGVDLSSLVLLVLLQMGLMLLG